MMFLAMFSLWLILPAGVWAENIVVITHSDIAPGSVNTDTIKKIYSGYITKWPDNKNIIVATTDKAPYHEIFTKTYVGKTPSQFSANWKSIMFSGKGILPTNFNSAEELIDFVSKNEGAIGYANADAIPKEGVSVQK